MSQYQQGLGQHVTMIDDLPDLDQMQGLGPQPFQTATRGHQRQSRYPEEDGMGGSPEQHPKYQKFIRNSGGEPPSESGMRDSRTMMQELPTGGQPQQMVSVAPVRDGPSCLDVADHIENCPICSKLYKDDKTVYLIAIVVLAIICIILLKKVLDV